MAIPTSGIFKATTLLFLTMLLCGTALADSRAPRRRGKVIIIRGAFTVFSLGMNDLGKKLTQRGLDVEVIADISAGRAAAKLRAEYQRNRNIGPIVFVGHSRGAELGPKQARYLQKYKIPVKLVVMVDAIHRTSIPSNVERCVNLYQNSALSFPHGTPARADSKRTQLLNTDIDRLRSRNKGGSINHFNIDASPWIHELVIAEVLKVCPVVGSESAPAMASKPAPATARQSTPARTRKSAPAVARRKSKSGLRYPASIARGLWAGSAVSRSSTSSSSTRANSRGTTQRGRGRTYRTRSSTSRNSGTHRLKTAQRPGSTRTSRSGSKTATRPRTRTATRPRTRTKQRIESAGTKRSSSSSSKKPNATSAKKSGTSVPKVPHTNSPKKKKSPPVQLHVNG